MLLSYKSFSVALCLSGLLLTSCNNKHSKAEIETAMKKYDRLILKKDADSIAGLFLPDGKLGEMATGRDSIRKFLSSFANVRVLSQSSTSDSIKITGDTALQNGKYIQVDLLSEKDTITVRGEYTVTWQWVKNEGWYIKQINTMPSK